MKHLLHCKIFGHDFKVTRKVTYHVKEYSCRNCNKQLTTNGNGHLIELSPKFKEINDVLQRIHEKRNKKLMEKNAFKTLLVFKH